MVGTGEGIWRLPVAAGLWTVSGMLVTLYVLSPHWTRGMGTLGVFVALVALAVTVNLIVDHKLRKHQARVKDILAASGIQQPCDVDRIY